MSIHELGEPNGAILNRLDNQSLEQILVGYIFMVCGRSGQVFRLFNSFDYGIDGEIEFKDDNGVASGRRIYLQLKSGNSHLRNRMRDGKEVFYVQKERHLNYWTSQPADVFLVIRESDSAGGNGTVRWMNVTNYLKLRRDKKSRLIIFHGEPLNAETLRKVRGNILRR